MNKYYVKYVAPGEYVIMLGDLEFAQCYENDTHPQHPRERAEQIAEALNYEKHD